MRDRLVDLINEAKDEYPTIPTVNCCKPTFDYYLADRLLANGAIVPPCKVNDSIFVLQGKSVAEKRLSGSSFTPTALSPSLLIGEEWDTNIYPMKTLAKPSF